MRKLEEIEKDIEQASEHLHALYEEHLKSFTQDIIIDKTKYYIFYDPDDEDIMYTAKVFNYWRNNEGKYQFLVTGIQECLSDMRDSCYIGFDAMYSISVCPEKLNNFLNNFTEITKEEFDNKVDDLYISIKKWIKYWIDDE